MNRKKRSQNFRRPSLRELDLVLFGLRLTNNEEISSDYVGHTLELLSLVNHWEANELVSHEEFQDYITRIRHEIQDGFW